MVKFGERLLNGLMRPGWEHAYLDYEKLKTIIDGIKMETAQTGSEAFLVAFTSEIAKVDSFVSEHLVNLKRTLSPDASAAILRNVEADINNVRNFVGTNVIAATKIAKKHDKHVPDKLQKRAVIAGLIRNSKGLSALPAINAQLQAAVRKHTDISPRMNATPGVPGAVQIDINNAEEDSEGGLRSLPTWLLQGAQADASATGASDAEFYDTFYTTYLQDWTFGGDTNEEEGKSLIRTGDAADRVPGAVDEWNVDFSSDVAAWKDLNAQQRILTLVIVFAKLCFILFALYAFICSLDFLANGFRLVAGKQAGEVFRTSEIFNNPVAGMLVGVLVTVLVQSSSTSTSIIITMVAAELFTVKQAIALIMGANIGTSVTSTIVALAQVGNRDEFRRAFAAATVHDMFNFLTVLILLPLEAATGYLYHLSLAIINSTPSLDQGSKPPDILKALTKPFTSIVIKIDKKLITRISAADTPEKLAELDGQRMLVHFFNAGPEDMSDGIAGLVILVVALAVLCITLFLIVWTLKSLLKGRVAVWLHKSVNGDVPDLKLGSVTVPLGWLSGYLAMGVGLLVTICVQSSSITTSALTPLVGIGVISVERMYPTVLGANIGTCVTGVLAALAADASKLYLTLQVAYAHLLFNISGILILYCIWPLRALPINAAKHLGNTTAKYRWFAIAYLIFCFFLIPLVFMGLSFGGVAPVVTVAALVVTTCLLIALINVMQKRRPHLLPEKLRSWDFLPLYLRSLEPVDRLVCVPIDQLICTPLRKCCAPICKSKNQVPHAKVLNTGNGLEQASSTTSASCAELTVATARLGSHETTNAV